MIAVASPADGVTVWGSLQCPYYVHKALTTLFGLPEHHVRVVQMETGGGFGGKEEYPSLIAAHAALLAWKSGRPVKLVYDRAEDMVATTKRHPSRTRHRTAVDRDGRLLAMDIDFVLDGGAYCTLSPVVLSRGTIHAAGPYFCPNVRIRGRAVATSTPPHGAFRGFGAPQSLFALERHMNVVADADRARARRAAPAQLHQAGPDERGRPGHARAGRDGPAARSRAGAVGLSREGRALRARPIAARAIKKGIGFATFMHGAGFTGSGEVHLASVVEVEATAEGRVRVLAASTEIGQGTNTIFSQIVADALGIDYEDVDVAQPDTAHGAQQRADRRVAHRDGRRPAGRDGRALDSSGRSSTRACSPSRTRPRHSRAACRAVRRRRAARFARRAATSRRPASTGTTRTIEGDAYGAYAWAVYVAEVSVDTATYETRVDDFVAVQEIGKVIHPVLAAGQIEGGVAQAIGYALYEHVVWRDGRMANAQMTNYIMPTSMDLPPIRVYFEERPYAHGPCGAKGIGELPMDGVAPAIANAIEQAMGVRVDRDSDHAGSADERVRGGGGPWLTRQRSTCASRSTATSRS